MFNVAKANRAGRRGAVMSTNALPRSPSNRNHTGRSRHSDAGRDDDPVLVGLVDHAATGELRGAYAYNNGAKGEDRKRILPVDYFEPNPWGLYQVHGNVWSGLRIAGTT